VFNVDLMFLLSCIQDNPLLVECFDFDSSGDHELIGYAGGLMFLSFPICSEINYILACSIIGIIGFSRQQ
jgi:hypothetical protein